MNNMISYEKAIVNKIIKEYEDITWLEVGCKSEVKKVVNYNELTGRVKPGDKLAINTTAVNLGLGTGGQHFVIFNYSNEEAELKGDGHIMKLRYTPYQMRVLSVEEEASPHHEIFKEFKSLDKHIVIVATLHSMLAPITAMVKYLKSDAKINYIMTDAGALPISFSNTVRDLKEKKLIDKTITIGHAFGGDYEAVNIYTGLICSKELLAGDISIITMGPGIVGTGTKYGFSGIEQGFNIDAVNSLGGYPLVVPRIGFKDARPRHRGLSHQTITVLKDIAKTRGNIVFPMIDKDKAELIKEQLELNNISEKHNIFIEDGGEIEDALGKYELFTTTMGRGIDQEKEFFYSLGAVGRKAVNLLNKEWEICYLKKKLWSQKKFMMVKL